MGSLEKNFHPAIASDRPNLATMEDLSEFEDDGDEDDCRTKFPLPTMADMEVSPVVNLSNDQDYEQPTYRQQPGLRRYRQTLRSFVPSKISDRDRDVLPVDHIGFCSFLMYSWMTSFLWNIYRHGASAMKVYRCAILESCSLNSQRLEYLWSQEVKANGSMASLSVAISKFIRTRMYVSAFMFTVGLVLGFFTPVVIVYKLMEFVNDSEAPLMDGLMYPIAILLLDTVRMFIFSAQWAMNIRTALRVRTAVLGLIFKKIVYLNTLGNKSVGEIINLFANDSTRVLEYAMLGHLWIGGTAVILLSLGYVFWILGIPAFACLGVFASFYATMFGTSKLICYYRRKAVKTSDQRVRQMTEILNCMKIIKLYAWEEPFMKKTTEIRNRERAYLEKLGFLQSFGNSASNAVPIIAAISSFVTCFALDYSLNAAQVFSILGALIMTRAGLMLLPLTAGKVAEFRSAVERLQSVLVLEDMSMVTSTPKDPGHAVVFKNASFAWDSLIPDSPAKSGKAEGSAPKKKKTKSKNGMSKNGDLEKAEERKGLTANSKEAVKVPALHNINLIVPKGQLVGICGSVGSGKSSLISAILGQMHLLSGDLALRGSCAYVAQQAWIMNESVVENIVFGAGLDHERLARVIRCCELLEDIQALPGGLEAEIGERGINLSGGQKQRISLARAVYSERDVYFMDDPLSAVDYRVGARIFQNCFRGALRTKTVLFVSHQIHYLEQCDYVVVMKDGRIVEQGNPRILQKNAGTYADLLQLLQAQQQEAAKDAKKHEAEGNPDMTAPGSPKSDRGDNANDGNGRITAEEVKELGTISYDTYVSYIRAMGGAPVALAIVLIIGVNHFTTIFSNWWLSEMLTKRQPTPSANDSSASLASGNFSLPYGNVSTEYFGVAEDAVLFVDNDLLVYGLMICAILLSCLLRAWMYVKGTLRAATVLHKDVLSKVIQSPMRFFETVPIGRTINIFSKDLDEVDMALTNVMELFLSLVWSNVAALLIISVVFPWFIIPLVVILVLFLAFTLIFQAGLREVKRCENSSRSPLFGHINAMIQGLATIHAYGKEEEFFRRFLRLQDENTVLQNLFLYSTRWVALRLDLLVVVIMVFTSTFVVFSRGVIPVAFAGLTMAYSAQLSGLLQFLVRNMAETQARFTNVERIVRNIKTLALEGSEKVPSVVPASTWPMVGEITFSDVELRYREGLPLALDGLSFRVRAGEKVGIVGRTGSGKSSLGTALFRLVELARGTISIDGIDIATIKLRTLRSKLSLIPQDPVLFIGTIRYNLDPFGQCSDEDVWEALERTRLKDKISALDKQLFAPVVENGENFSVGERQLICLARALLRGSKIILLDEATASVDAKTDAMVQDILQEAFAKCTILTIAHRIHTVLNYDRILVLRKGKIQLFDDPQTLRADPKSYLSLLLKESLDKCKSAV